MKDAYTLTLIILVSLGILALLGSILRAALKLPKRNAYVKPVTDTRSSITQFRGIIGGRDYR